MRRVRRSRRPADRRDECWTAGDPRPPSGAQARAIHGGTECRERWNAGTLLQRRAHDRRLGHEPMHTHTELARLVWELRRELEPLGATQVVVNERRRGYRLVTCAEAASSTSTGPSTDVPIRAGSDPTRPSRRLLWILAAALAVGLAAIAAVTLTRDSDGAPAAGVSTNADTATFVDRIENVLEQSAAGRREIRAALNAGFSCSISPDEAARRISSVADNRQSILQQLGSLQTPTPETDDIVTLLQRALQQSIEADRHYRDGFLEIQAGMRCPLPSNPSFDLAAKSDKLATVARNASSRLSTRSPENVTVRRGRPTVSSADRGTRGAERIRTADQ